MTPERLEKLKKLRNEFRTGKPKRLKSHGILSAIHTVCELIDYIEELTSDKIGVHDVVQVDWELKSNESGTHVVTEILPNGFYRVDYGLVIDCKGVQRIGKAKQTPTGFDVRELEETERNRVWGE